MTSNKLSSLLKKKLKYKFLIFSSSATVLKRTLAMIL